MHPVFHAFLAQTAETQAAPSGTSALISQAPMFIAIAAVFYFLMIRPQQKQAKQHQGFLAGLAKGTEVVTQGGLIGTVVLVEDRTVTVDVGGGTKVRVLKANVVGAWQEKPPAPAVKPEKK
jgi:preprotein translocase subunit YajC